MKASLRTRPVLALVALLLGCGPEDPSAQESLSDAQARVIVDRMNREWDAAVLAGDFEASAAMYADDAIRMQPDIPALIGRDAIAAWLQSQTDTYTFEGSNEILEVRALSPEWILMRSTGTFTASPRTGGDSRTFTEKWLTLVQRQPDGSWQWYRDAGSSDLPR